MTFLEIPRNSIRDSIYLVHFEIRQKRVQNDKKKVQKEPNCLATLFTALIFYAEISRVNVKYVSRNTLYGVLMTK